MGLPPDLMPRRQTAAILQLWEAMIPRVYTTMIEAGLDDAIAKGATPILIGHSLGADMVVQECNRLKGTGVKVPLAGVVDPVDWTSNSTQPGIWQISDNVDVVINPYQNNYPGGGHVERAADNGHTDVRLMHMPQYPHASNWLRHWIPSRNSGRFGGSCTILYWQYRRTNVVT